MFWFLGSVAFLLGLSIGSFINAWSFRLGTKRSILEPSSCRSCGRRLSWFELVPLLSFFLLRGRCRTCKVRLSPQYPLVELAGGILFVLIFYKLGDYSLLHPPLRRVAVEATTNFVFWSTLLAIAVYDRRTTIIPDSAALLAGIVGFFSPLMMGGTFLSWEHLLAGPLLAAPLAAFWLFSRGRWMGLGDAKLMLGIGWFLGLSIGFTGLLFAFWIGAAAGVALIAIGKMSSVPRYSFKSELPFGPSLALGAFLAWFFQFDIMSLWY